jgi:hypothetical protein
LTLDAQSAVVYGSLNQRITSRFFGGLLLQYQNSTFNGGVYDNKTERYFLLGVNLRYAFNPYLSADAGYNYDNVDSEVGRTYDRNRVYIGVTASY